MRGSPIVGRMTALRDFSQQDRQHVLLAVREWHEEVRAGLGGATAAVRTLDGVSLAVHAGELVILRGGVASGASTLLSALAGTRAGLPAAHRVGHRIAARGVQIRRAAISIDAFRALHAVWTASLPIERTSRVIYCFRVRVERQRPEDDEPWRAWARALRAGGGSVIAHLSHDDQLTYPRDRALNSASVFESAVDSGPPERTLPRPGSVHDCTLAGGRIVRRASGALRTDPLHSSRRRAQDRFDHEARDGHH